MATAEQKEAELIGHDPCITVTPDARITLSKEFTEAQFDYKLEEQRKLLELKFGQTEQPKTRVTHLMELKGHVASCTNKIIKLFSHMNISQGQISSATKALAAQQNLLQDKGLTSEDFNATTLSQTLDQLNTDFNLVKGRIQGVDFNSVKDMMPQFIALQGQIGQINVETLDRSVNDHQASIDNLQPLILQERQGVQDLVDNATALQPLVPHANELLDLPARVQVIENAEAQPLDTDIDAKV